MKEFEKTMTELEKKFQTYHEEMHKVEAEEKAKNAVELNESLQAVQIVEFRESCDGF